MAAVLNPVDLLDSPAKFEQDSSSDDESIQSSPRLEKECLGSPFHEQNSFGADKGDEMPDSFHGFPLPAPLNPWEDVSPPEPSAVRKLRIGLPPTRRVRTSSTKHAYDQILANAMPPDAEEVLASMIMKPTKTQTVEQAKLPVQFCEIKDSEQLPFARPRVNASTNRRSQTGENIPLFTTGNIVMTKEKYDQYRKGIASFDRLVGSGSSSALSSSSDDELEQDNDLVHWSDEELTEKQRRRQAALQRQKIDAGLSVLRQKMIRITDQTNSTKSTTFDAAEADDEQNELDDIPLSILKAHNCLRSRRRGSSVPTVNRTPEPCSSRTSRLFSDNSSISSNTLPCIEEGHPTTRSGQTSSSFDGIPGLLPDGRHISRGLIGEIAREEELKKRRRSAISLNSGAASSLSMPYSSDRPPEIPVSSSIASIQRQLHQLGEVQLQIMSRLKGQLDTTGSVRQQPYAATSPHASPNPPRTSYLQMSMNDGMMRTPHTSGCFGALPNGAGFGQQSLCHSPYPGSTGVVMPCSSPGYYGSPRYSSAGSVSSFNTSPSSSSMSISNGSSISLPPKSSPMATHGLNRPAMMKIVTMDEGEDEDEDAHWKKLAAERQALRDQWKAALSNMAASGPQPREETEQNPVEPIST